jgi:hypothetical protein
MKNALVMFFNLMLNHDRNRDRVERAGGRDVLVRCLTA